MACVSGVVLLANPLPVRSSHLRDTGRERGEGKVRLSIAARTRDTGKQGEALDRSTRPRDTPHPPATHPTNRRPWGFGHMDCAASRLVWTMGVRAATLAASPVAMKYSPIESTMKRQ